jgi:hypothetical protein
LIENPDLGLGNIGPIVEYLRFNRQLCRLKPACKQSKRRAAEEFSRQVQAWRSRPAVLKRSASPAWKRSGIGEFEHQDERHCWHPAFWTIRELLDRDQLLDEGRSMRHCVGRYAVKCADGASSIWSLTCSDSRSQCRRELTIEVNSKSRKIIQARGIGDSWPTREARRVMLLWAKHEGLGVENWI